LPILEASYFVQVATDVVPFFTSHLFSPELSIR
jgi:hypothetical protein